MNGYTNPHFLSEYYHNEILDHTSSYKSCNYTENVEYENDYLDHDWDDDCNL